MSKYIDDCYCNNHNNYTAEIRTQLSILEDSDTICDLLEAIADEGINIDGYLYQNIQCDNNLFTFVVGNKDEQSESDLRTVKCILKKWCIDYIESDTVRVSAPTNKPGVLAKIYCALNDCLDIYSSYNASCNAIYIETSDSCKAAKIINSLS
ncbi:hypothetical protein ABFP60_06280 [Clostridioides difficile]